MWTNGHHLGVLPTDVDHRLHLGVEMMDTPGVAGYLCHLPVGELDGDASISRGHDEVQLTPRKLDLGQRFIQGQTGSSATVVAGVYKRPGD
jgi:hypothetical protein